MTRSSSLLLLACGALTGCAALTKSDLPARRYFTPEAQAVQSPAAATRAPGARLHLAPVSAWSHLHERMVVRTAAHEITFSETRRWTERPDVYLRRALSRALFDERGLSSAGVASWPSLRVELAAFEELEQPRRALFQARFVLSDESGVRLEETVILEQPVESATALDPAIAIADALSKVLALGAEQIADKVTAKLPPPPK